MPHWPWYREPVGGVLRGVGVGLVVARVGIGRTAHLAGDFVRVKVQYPHTVACRHIALVLIHAHKSASVALGAGGVDSLGLVQHFEGARVGHGDASAGDVGSRITFLLGYQIKAPFPDGSILVGAPQFMARILGLEYAVMPVVAVGVVRQQVVQRAVLVPVPILVHIDYAAGIIHIIRSGNGRSRCHCGKNEDRMKRFHISGLRILRKYRPTLSHTLRSRSRTRPHTCRCQP